MTTSPSGDSANTDALTPAQRIDFQDIDPTPGEIGGTVIITRAKNESAIRSYVLYWGINEREKRLNTPIIATISPDSISDESLKLEISKGTKIPTNATHFLLFSRNDETEMKRGVSVLIEDYKEIYTPPETAKKIRFRDSDSEISKIGGIATITRAANESGIDKYTLYWGKSASEKLEQTLPIASIRLDASSDEYLKLEIPRGTEIPTGATYLLLFSRNNEMEMKEGVSTLFLDYKGNADGKGPGGNEKIGKYYYGEDRKAFQVYKYQPTDEEGNKQPYQCVMDNDFVMVVNINGKEESDQPYSYVCGENNENTYKEMGTWNVGFNPLNDAYYHAQVVYDMYEHYLGEPPLPSKLKLKVYYDNYMDRAFWDGTYSNFGDGDWIFYPMVSLDVIAHEISHGFTQHHSGLKHKGKAGGINEAFSDIAGEAAKHYLKTLENPEDPSPNKNDWIVNQEIFYGDGGLRYFDYPASDGRSIETVLDYKSGLGVHDMAGIFNKAFYKLATTKGWNTETAFLAFLKANREKCWYSDIDFIEAAQCVLDKEGDHAKKRDIRKAFSQVDINLVAPGLNANFQAKALFNTVTFNNTSYRDSSGDEGVNWFWDFGDNTPVSTEKVPVHKYEKEGTYTVTLTITDSTSGETDSFTREITVLSDYCKSSGSDFSQDFIEKVELIGATETPLLSNSSSAAAYTYFQNQSATLSQGEEYTIQLTTGSTSSVSWGVWIDLNRDGLFDHDKERLFYGAGSPKVSGKITIPKEAKPGKTRMRVSLDWSSYPKPCGIISFGEVEDYNITIDGSSDLNLSDSMR